jgi:hypothetical protein
MEEHPSTIPCPVDIPSDKKVKVQFSSPNKIVTIHFGFEK